MSKFNTTAVNARRAGMSVNLAGGTSYKITDVKKEIASVILASMLNGDSYYQSDASRIAQVFNLVKNLDDKSFAAKAMIYARQEGNLRSISHVLANAIAEASTEGFSLRNAIKSSLVRPDDMIEMFALWKSRHGKKMVPNSFRRAFKDVLDAGKWDAYQLKKYSKGNSDVKLRDIILVSHPKDEKGLYKGVIEGTLTAPKTVESMLSSGESAADTFDVMLKEGRLGYMVAIKNIRNALETGISNEALDMWCKLVSDPKRVAKSRMLPFRFVDAWDAVKDLSIDAFKLRKVKSAMNAALIASAQNLDFVNAGERIAIILDESGSMSGDPWKHGITLAATLYHALPKENVVVYGFASDAREINFGDMQPLDIIFNIRPNGGATYFHKPLELLTKTGTKVDRIVMLSDMQLYVSGHGYYRSEPDQFDTYFNTYKSRVSPSVKFLFWNLAGYPGGTPLELRNDIMLASGFSEKLLSIIPKMWVDQDALVKEIEAISI